MNTTVIFPFNQLESFFSLCLNWIGFIIKTWNIVSILFTWNNNYDYSTPNDYIKLFYFIWLNCIRLSYRMFDSILRFQFFYSSF